MPCCAAYWRAEGHRRRLPGQIHSHSYEPRKEDGHGGIRRITTRQGESLANDGAVQAVFIRHESGAELEGMRGAPHALASHSLVSCMQVLAILRSHLGERHAKTLEAVRQLRELETKRQKSASTRRHGHGAHARHAQVIVLKFGAALRRLTRTPCEHREARAYVFATFAVGIVTAETFMSAVQMMELPKKESSVGRALIRR